MRDHPIPPVTESMQYRAIGIVRGIYQPEDQDCFTRGYLVDSDGIQMEAVVLGRVLTLMRRHLDMNKPHLWVVYPRCRESGKLHLQIAGIWEPSTLNKNNSDKVETIHPLPEEQVQTDRLPEGDDYFSIRGELIFTRPETGEIVIKVRQQPRPDRPRSVPFKLHLKGEIQLDKLHNFVSLDIRRKGQYLSLEGYEIIGKIPSLGGKRKGAKSSTIKRRSDGAHSKN